MGGPIQVLHVDDSEFTDRAATSLEREYDRLTVDTTTTARDGLGRVADRDIDCIVSDYGLPGQNGIEFLRAVQETAPDLPFILLTGDGSEEVASEAISAGVTDYLQKDADTEQYELLARRIVDAVERRRAETNYRQIFEKSPDGIVVHDPADGSFVDVNAEYADMFGYEREGLLEAGFSAVLPDESPYTAAAARKRIQRAVDQGSRTFEWPGVRRNGERFWAEVHLTPARLHGTEQVLAVVRDVTDRKESEQALERYRAVVDSVPDMMYVLDDEFRFTLTNDAIEEEMGYSRAELRDAHASLLFDEDALHEGQWNGEWIVNSDRDRGHLEIELETATGDRIPCEVRGAVLSDTGDSDGSRTVGIIRDISQRKAREQKLQARSAAMDASIDGMAILDENGEYVFVNQAHAEIYGYEDPDAFLGQTWQVCYGDEELDRFENAVMPELNEDGFWRGEAVGLCKDGSTFPQELSLSTTDDDRIICVVRDITDRKRREHELERQNERLEKFTGTVSHDLRNPLNVAAGRVELADEDCDSAHLAAAKRALDRSQTLIDELLTLAQQGDQVGDIKTISLATVTERCWQNVTTENATLVTETEQRIRADPDRLAQLLENLVRNAVEHGNEDVRITVGALEDGFYVADNGSGIPPDERESVFEAGYSMSADGTGFGLSIVSEIVSAHGWDVKVTESASGGARFEITGIQFAE